MVANDKARAIGFPLRPTPPEEPLTRIRPHKSWAAVDAREVWAHRELFLLLMWRDLKVRYKQTLLGAAWVILQPLMMTLVFTIFLGLFAPRPVRDVPYPVFLYAGLLPWTFFSSATLGGSQSLVSNAKLIRKIYFPRVLLPLAAVGVRLADFIISFAFVFVMMLYYGIRPSASLLALPLVVFCLVLLAVSIGTWVAALNINYGDVGTILPVVLQVFMFASPIIYPSSLVPEKWRLLYYMNPMAGIIENFRASLFGLGFNWASLGVSFAVTLVSLACISFTFRRMEDDFADTI
ncbi:MAG TPA: ABC transporter permease [Pyrinomonadaceae bacterium]|nr:ABC transporter permease [Pyrinomonadaceae bacterium]